MRKLFLILLTFISLNIFGQNDFFKVKEGSFRQIEGYVMFDKDEHYDDNDKPMALIKISTENITAAERRKITFKGNLETYFDVRIEPSEIYLYLSAQAADFIEIHHPDYGKTEFALPYDLKDFCGYEMVLSYVPVVETAPAKDANLIVKTNPLDVNIYINDKHYGQTPNIVNGLTAGTYNLKLTKDGCYSITKTITLEEGQTLTIDETLRYIGKDISISTDKSGDEIYVDGERIGISPVNVYLTYGTHEVQVKRGSQYETKSIEVTETSDTKLKVEMGQTIQITSNKTGDKVFVDKDKVGKTPLQLNLSLGYHDVMVKRGKKKDTETIFLNGELNKSYNFYPSRSYPFWSAMGDACSAVGGFFGDVGEGIGDFFGNIFDDGFYFTLGGGIKSFLDVDKYELLSLGLDVGTFFSENFGVFVSGSMWKHAWSVLGGINFDTSIITNSTDLPICRIGVGYSISRGVESPSSYTAEGMEYLFGFGVGEQDGVFMTVDMLSTNFETFEFRACVGYRW